MYDKNFLTLQDISSYISYIMSKFVVYLKMKPFVAQWAIYHFGNPITFPPQSVGNARIIAVLRRRPEGVEPDLVADGLTPVAIPYSKQKDPESWNYLTPSAKKFIVEYIESIFQDNLYSEFKEMVGDSGKAKLQRKASWAWKG